MFDKPTQLNFSIKNCKNCFRCIFGICCIDYSYVLFNTYSTSSRALRVYAVYRKSDGLHNLPYTDLFFGIIWQYHLLLRK